MEKRRIVLTVAATVCITIIAWTALLMSFAPHILNFYGSIKLNVGLNQMKIEVHSTVRFYQHGKLIYEFVHPGEVTYIGLNQTLFWIFGNASWQEGAAGSYMSNVTWISIGNQGTLNQASTQLPGEWNRTAAYTYKNTGQSIYNASCTFIPDAGGPYTADCMGWNWESSGDNNLWAYDTFPEVSGIDATFTINLEFGAEASS